ncbi:MAG: zf-HC2 domain-containing protein [Acidobacteria bacterium]|nr:zf-HC2 domain-containing protein [Acidobacteriota bacterium]
MSEHLREEEFIPYLDARLSDTERRRLDLHLADCAACRARRDELRALLGVLGEWEAVEPSPGFDAALQARLEEEAQRPVWFGLRPAYAVALAGAVVAVIGLLLWRSVPPTTGPPPVAQTPPEVVEPAPGGETPGLQAGDELAALDNPVLLENYELLEEFDILFEPAGKEEKKL